MCVHVPSLCLVPVEEVNWRYRWLWATRWMLGMELGSSGCLWLLSHASGLKNYIFTQLCSHAASFSYLLEVIKLLLQHLNLLQVCANLFTRKSGFFLIDPLLQLVRFPKQHELLTTLLQHSFPLLTQFQQRLISDRSQEGDKMGKKPKMPTQDQPRVI